ncbi:activating transcription factor of chaperone [Ixodes scapularis]|uniref:activating transcription factor of chaperone n=1 Tax=Ixodes scapularis TaxID=6945 RepID=UPI001A9CF01A|nr:activating transcription factor of chaperone [Ixodes scapularis]
MEVDWDLDSVLELCCSKLSPEVELPTLDDEGHLDWLDEKVDLSAWADLDFPDDLPPAAMTEAGHPPFADRHLPRVSSGPPKSEDPWQSAETAYFPSPEYISPPDSPGTPVAIVPNVDIFLNLSPASSIETSVRSPDAESLDGLPGDADPSNDFPPEDASKHAAAEYNSPSPPYSPTLQSPECSCLASSQNADEMESTGVAESFPEIIEEVVAAPSTSMDLQMECQDDPTDRDFVPEESESEEERPKARRPGPKRGRAKKSQQQRRKRKAADAGSRRERKRLQNKDAATRYRRKKKQECDVVEEEFQELSRINDNLKAEAARVGNEVSYLKGLMRELFRAKGLLP